jgi:hypothetical protein
MSRFLILIGPRENPRLRFEAMAPDSFAATNQHLGLVAFGERLEVIALSAVAYPVEGK